MNKIFSRGASLAALCLAGAANGATVWNIDPETDGFVGLTNAVAQSVRGDTINIGEGVIYLDGTINPGTKVLKIHGAGPEKTILDGQGQWQAFNYNCPHAWIEDVYAGPSPELADLKIRNCRHHGDGAGAYILRDANYGDGICPYYYVVTNLVVENCVAYGEAGETVRGGGLFVSGAKVAPLRDIVIRNCAVTNLASSGSSYGGGLYLAGSWNMQEVHSRIVRVTVEGCSCTARIPENKDEGGKAYGGGVYMDSPFKGAYDCSFVSNVCLGEGGAFYKTLHPDYGQFACVFSNVLVKGNSATSYGGGYSSGTNKEFPSTFVDCAFIGNSTHGEASPLVPSSGNICVDGGGTFDRCLFKGNTVVVDAAAILSKGKSEPLVVRDCVFDGNHATGSTAGIHSSGAAPVSVDRCLFLDNVSDKFEYWSAPAGVLYSSSAGSCVRNSYFARNSGMCVSYGFSLVGCTVVDNTHFYDERGYLSTSSYYSGAIVLDRTHGLTNCLVYGNTTTKRYSGGGTIRAANVTEKVNVNNRTVGGEVSHCLIGAQLKKPMERTEPEGDWLLGLVYGGETANEELTACPKVVNAAEGDWRPTRTSELREKAVRFDWMEADGALDAGDGTYAIENATVDRTEGIRLTLNNARPRIFGDDPDVGCFEYYCAPGLMLILR